jgi:cytochrome P450
VEEGLRLHPVTQFIVRIPRDDMTIGDLHVRKGRRVILNLLAASRDPDRFERADEFLLPRTGPDFDIPFGWGMHHCLGATLAQVEMEEALRVLTETYRDVRVTGIPEATPPQGMLQGPESLLLEFAERA